MKKRPDITDGVERSKEACRTVFSVFKSRPWVVELWETVQNEEDDKNGFDMFVRVDHSFLKTLRMGGTEKILPIQIKSADRRIKAFIREYKHEKRFFNHFESRHQFVLCGLDKADFVLADIMGQIVVHVSGFGMSEKQVLDYLDSLGDKEAILAYLNNKRQLCYLWYWPHSHRPRK